MPSGGMCLYTNSNIFLTTILPLSLPVEFAPFLLFHFPTSTLLCITVYLFFLFQLIILLQAITSFIRSRLSKNCSTHLFDQIKF